MFRPLLARSPLVSRPLSILRPCPIARPAVRHQATSAAPATSAPEPDAETLKWQKVFDEAPNAEAVQEQMNLVLARSSLPPTPIIASMLFAARRVDDFALAVRILDVVEHKLGGGLWKTKKGRKKEEWERVMGELKEVLDELGVPTRGEIYGTQHLGRYYHGPGEGNEMPPVS